MKILALVSLKNSVPLDHIRPHLVAELQGSWRLYSGDVIREAYLTESPSRVVFILEAPSSAEARVQLEKLPLVAEGVFEVVLVELRPFTNWSMLPAAH